MRSRGIVRSSADARHGGVRRQRSAGARSDDENAPRLYLLVLIVTIATIRGSSFGRSKARALARFGVRLGCCALPPNPLDSEGGEKGEQ